VLLRGESGCGKELFARAVHVNGPRRDKPFVKVDCAALPASLIENELFGHEKGAFTGADHRVPGKFEAADAGTVFIDEIGELPLPVQGKLLRVLQDREFERVGGTQTLKVDVRIVAATNRDLAKMVAEGKFREDLYYRIKVVELVLPPLRERGGEDIERLTAHFIAASAKRHRLPVPRLSAAALERLKRYRWPGNVRELENCIESAVVLSEGEILEEHLPLPKVVSAPPASTPIGDAMAPEGTGELLPLAEVEKRHILRVLDSVKGNRTAAAKVLQIGRNTLGRKLKEYGIADEG
jgi:Nif-specific regulatory protein